MLAGFKGVEELFGKPKYDCRFIKLNVNITNGFILAIA
jgi:hypothetical protein